MNENRIFQAQEPKKITPIPTGEYTGVIVGVSYRDLPFQYADVEIKIDTIPDATIEASFSCKVLTPKTDFGKLIGAYQPFAVGDTVDPKKILIGKKVALTVLNTPGTKDPNQKFPKVSKGSVIPIK